MRPVLVLALDTSTPAVTAGICALSGEAGSPEVRTLAERVTVDARAHAELLTPHLSACLDDAGLTADDLDAVVVGCGPGPFTGLRVGMATAAAFGDALDLPVHGVCSLDALAARAVAAGLTRDADGDLLVVTDARRREAYHSRHRAADGMRLSGPEVSAASAVDVTGVAIACGDPVRDDHGETVLRHTTHQVVRTGQGARRHLGHRLPVPAAFEVLAGQHALGVGGILRAHLGARAALPLPRMDLAEALVALHLDAQQAPERVGGRRGAQQVGADDHVRTTSREVRGGRSRLRQPGLGQRDVELPLPDAGGVVRGLAVPPQDQSLAHGGQSRRPGHPVVRAGASVYGSSSSWRPAGSGRSRSTVGQSFHSRSRP